jgi:VWFA-related protein
MRARLTTSAMTIAVSAALWASAPQEARQAGVPQPPVFRSGTDLVRLDIRVTDADGRPVADLRPDEFEITEAGTARPVLFFQHVQEPEGTYLEAARRTIAAEVSTNQGAPRGHVYVLVFDQSHIVAGNEQKARMAAERFLRRQVKPGDRVAAYSVPGPGPSITFTSDVARVIRELMAVRGSAPEAGTGPIPMRVYDAYQITRGVQSTLNQYVLQYGALASATDARTAGLRDSAGRSQDEAALLRLVVIENARTLVAHADEDSRQFLLRLSDIVRELRAVEGRKSVLLFSEGFQIDNVRRELETVAAAAAQSYSVVYAFDLNRRDVPLNEPVPRGGEQYSEIQGRLEPLGSLTAETDGALFIDAVPQLDRALTRIAGASQDYYLVGFAPGPYPQAGSGAYTRVKVRVTRPGATVSARSGYALGPSLSPDDRRRTIQAALGAPFAQQGLRVEYTTYVLRGTAGDLQRVILSAGAELPLGGPASGPADLVFAARSIRTGQIAASGSDTVPLPTSARIGATTGTGYYRAQMDLPPGDYMMRVVVREPGGLLGSADRRFRVRALGGPGVQAGDLIVGSSDVGGLPVRPSVYAGEAIDGVFETYARSTDALKNLNVLVELLPLGKPTALTSGRAALNDPAQTGTGASRGARVTIPTEGIQAGEYMVRATVRSGSEQVAELLREVSILAGSRPEPPPTAPEAPLRDVAPEAVIGGDVVKRYVEDLASRAAGQPLGPAAAHARAGRWADAEAAVPVGLRSADAQAIVGLSKFAHRDFPGAVAAWQIAVDADATNAGAAFLLGWAHAAGGDDRSAVSAWRTAIIADAALVPAYLAAIDAYLRLGQPDLALQVARSGRQAMPDSAELRDRVARLERR